MEEAWARKQSGTTTWQSRQQETLLGAGEAKQPSVRTEVFGKGVTWTFSNEVTSQDNTSINSDLLIDLLEEVRATSSHHVVLTSSSIGSTLCYW